MSGSWGLGPLRDIDLPKAREAAAAARLLVRQNIDPIEHRKEQRANAEAQAKGTITFEAYARRYIDSKQSRWKSQKHRQQWSNSLRDYAFPIIGKLAIPDIEVEAVRKVLGPIWNDKKETARRVRGQIEAILNGAKADKLRTGDNPALWRGNLDQLLAKRRKSDVKHHAALSYEEMPAFWRSLAGDTSDAAQMLLEMVNIFGGPGGTTSSDWTTVISTTNASTSSGVVGEVISHAATERRGYVDCAFVTKNPRHDDRLDDLLFELSGRLQRCELRLQRDDPSHAGELRRPLPTPPGDAAPASGGAFGVGRGRSANSDGEPARFKHQPKLAFLFGLVF